MTLNRKIYDRTFKEKAVIQSYKSVSLTRIEKELDITPSLLTRWRKEYAEFGAGSFRGSGNLRISDGQEKIQELEKKCKETELYYEILKKGSPYLLQGRHSAYEFIKKHQDVYPVYKMCRILGIGETGYNTWKRQLVSETKQRIILLKEEITSIFLECKRRYGCVRIAEELKKRGTNISRTQVSLYMNQLGLHPKAKRKFKITTDSKHNLYTSPNILNQQFIVSATSMIWLSDITYIQTSKRFLYLTIIMDLYDRKIIGWSLSSTMSAERTSLAAWEMAVSNRQIKKGLIFHSDRGVQYACRAFTRKVDSYNCITRSMSRKGNHLDNAAAESFFNTLKRELIYHYKLLPKKQMTLLVIDYIENWYNKERIHSSLQYKTIGEFNAHTIV